MNAILKFDINRLTRASDRRRSHRRARPGFSITEMLVVVGIIVLLASLLMVAMGRVRSTALASQTLSIMQSFAAACDAFYLEHGMYPGVIPDRVLAMETATLQGGSEISFTSTENALLHLMGGYRLQSPNSSAQEVEEFDNYVEDYEIVFGATQWRLKIKLQEIGEGPIINGKPYPSYYTPGANEVAVAAGQYLADDVRIPDLIDAWGQPILYMRQVRNTGPLVGDNPIDRPQFLFGSAPARRFGGMSGYLLAGTNDSPGLGEYGRRQVFDSTDNPDGSILTHPDANHLATFAQIIRHPAFGPEEDPLGDGNWQRIAARGAYVLISAGRDGIFFSATDGPGTNSDPVHNIVTGQFANPRVIEDYDDIIFFGGG